MLLECPGCRAAKPPDAFYPGRRKCRPCVIALTRASQRARPPDAEKKSAYDAAWRAANPTRAQEHSRKHYAALKADPLRRAARSAARDAWRAANPDKVAAGRRRQQQRRNELLRSSPALRAPKTARNAARRAVEARATPPWADRAAIDAMYRLAANLRICTGESAHVDHIVPLRSDLVCGLHCEANLRVIPGKENMSKSNRTWPDMP